MIAISENTLCEQDHAELVHNEKAIRDDNALRFQQNEEHMERETKDWKVKSLPKKMRTEMAVKVVVNPTVPKMTHRLLNPFIYRNIQDACDLSGLAYMLNVSNWEEHYELVEANLIVRNCLNVFRDLPKGTSKSEIQTQFGMIVSMLAVIIGVPIEGRAEAKNILGGFLVKNEYDVRSRTSFHVKNANGCNLLAAVTETQEAFPVSVPWYYQSRGIQTLCALYSLGCPTILYSQKYFKVFMENSDRNAIYTFPYNDEMCYSKHVRSTLVQPMGRSLLKAIVICLLPGKIRQGPIVPTFRMPSSELLLPQGYRSTAITNQSYRPQCISGYVHGQPVYTKVRLYTSNEVDDIESEIAKGRRLKKKRKHDFNE
ncbi:hypothetical protein HK103_003178 [Boothiomyces macroporosus]|uniref:Uncharacterized protein n=1 Tax=Boothiomyces macroporosus TaxID=261099 RepID=A0AAD5U9U1_9FUNG|nr:hypothetical protein HK103_003178 [Boothiomyces macroporosus]